ncbi:MAG: hypothetical protein ACI9I4_002338 [Neolewinella sp.]|jgi:hypothetical protein
MSINISSSILSLKGQRVNKIQHDQELNRVVITCSRDRRTKVIDPVTCRKGTVNQYVRRTIQDLPLFGQACFLDIQLAQVKISKNG